jgi:hypothetical protein
MVRRDRSRWLWQLKGSLSQGGRAVNHLDRGGLARFSEHRLEQREEEFREVQPAANGNGPPAVFSPPSGRHYDDWLKCQQRLLESCEFALIG